MSSFIFIKKSISVLFLKLNQIKIFNFGLIQMVGLALDFGIFSLFISFNSNLFISNIIAGICGVSFTYYASAKYIFYYKSKFILKTFTIYFLWNTFRIFFFSFIIFQITLLFNLTPIISKVIITAISFYCNFIFMSILMTGKLRYY